MRSRIGSVRVRCSLASHERSEASPVNEKQETKDNSHGQHQGQFLWTEATNIWSTTQTFMKTCTVFYLFYFIFFWPDLDVRLPPVSCLPRRFHAPRAPVLLFLVHYFDDYEPDASDYASGYQDEHACHVLQPERGGCLVVADAWRRLRALGKDPSVVQVFHCPAYSSIINITKIVFFLVLIPFFFYQRTNWRCTFFLDQEEKQVICSDFL